MLWLAVGGLAPVGAATRVEPQLLRDVHIGAHVSPETLTVGDRFMVEVRVDAPAGTPVAFARPSSTSEDLVFKDVQVQPPKPGDVAGPGGNGAPGSAPPRASWMARYTMAAFRVGPLTLPPLPVRVGSDSVFATSGTDSLRLFVRSVLNDSLAKADMRDLKPQATLPVSPWPWILLGLALVAIAALVWWYVRRRRRPRATVVPLAPARPAHEMALEALRRLETRRLPLDGLFKEYHIALSEILRRYLEDGFSVAALEETTDEILADLERHGFQKPFVSQVAALCAESDLVKFAKHEPTIEACVKALENVRDFVIASAPRLSGLSAAIAGAAAVGGGSRA